MIQLPVLIVSPVVVLARVDFLSLGHDVDQRFEIFPHNLTGVQDTRRELNQGEEDDENAQSVSSLALTLASSRSDSAGTSLRRSMRHVVPSASSLRLPASPSDDIRSPQDRELALITSTTAPEACRRRQRRESDHRSVTYNLDVAVLDRQSCPSDSSPLTYSDSTSEFGISTASNTSRSRSAWLTHSSTARGTLQSQRPVLQTCSVHVQTAPSVVDQAVQTLIRLPPSLSRRSSPGRRAVPRPPGSGSASSGSMRS